MSLEIAAALAVDTQFEAFGKPATFRPAAGAPIAVTVDMRRPDARADSILGPAPSAINVQTVTIEVRVSEIAAPSKNDQFTVAGVDYLINEKPQTLDPERLVWTCRCEKAPV